MISALDYHLFFATPPDRICNMNDTQTPTTAMPLITSNDSMPSNAATQTDEVEDPPLFPPHLISPDVTSSLPHGYTMRPLRRSDYHGGRAYRNFSGNVFTELTALQHFSQHSEF
jgi:hypothetical protein